MHLQSLLTLLPFISFTSAVYVCSGFKYTTGACSGPCLHYDIDIDTRVDTPGTNCIYNHDYDVGFNLLVCSGSDLTGDCYNLQELPKTDITGNFNWHTPGTNSILRTAT